MDGNGPEGPVLYRFLMSYFLLYPSMRSNLKRRINCCVSAYVGHPRPAIAEDV